MAQFRIEQPALRRFIGRTHAEQESLDSESSDLLDGLAHCREPRVDEIGERDIVG